MAGRKPTVRTQEWDTQVIDAYRRGQPIIRIAAQLGVAEKTISRTLRENGVVIRPR